MVAVAWRSLLISDGPVPAISGHPCQDLRTAGTKPNFSRSRRGKDYRFQSEAAGRLSFPQHGEKGGDPFVGKGCKMAVLSGLARKAFGNRSHRGIGLPEPLRVGPV